MKSRLLKYFDAKEYRLWGLLPIVFGIWNGLHTYLYINPQFLLFICYTASLLLGLGILFRVRLLIGIGFDWTAVAFPLFIYDSIITCCTISSAFFHISCFVVGLLAVARYKFPRYTWLAAIGFGFVWQFLARVFTNPQLNVNAAFRVYEGWEGMFSDYLIYTITMFTVFSFLFIIFQFISGSFFQANQQWSNESHGLVENTENLLVRDN